MCQQRIEFAEDFLVEGVGGNLLTVKHQPQPVAVFVADPVPTAFAVDTGHWLGAEKFLYGFHRHIHHATSTSMAPPCPPPMHSVAMPRLPPVRRSALTRWRTMRVPLVPTG